MSLHPGYFDTPTLGKEGVGFRLATVAPVMSKTVTVTLLVKNEIYLLIHFKLIL